MSDLTWYISNEHPGEGWYWIDLDDKDHPVLGFIPMDVIWVDVRRYIFRLAGPLVIPSPPHWATTEREAAKQKLREYNLLFTDGADECAH